LFFTFHCFREGGRFIKIIDIGFYTVDERALVRDVLRRASADRERRRIEDPEGFAAEARLAEIGRFEMRCDYMNSLMGGRAGRYRVQGGGAPSHVSCGTLHFTV